MGGRADTGRATEKVWWTGKGTEQIWDRKVEMGDSTGGRPRPVMHRKPAWFVWTLGLSPRLTWQQPGGDPAKMTSWSCHGHRARMSYGGQQEPSLQRLIKTQGLREGGAG